MSMLELREVSKVYGEGAVEVHALRGVDLSVEAGEMVAVMGPSGSGKTTLLTIAGSLEEPTSGEVLVAGAALSGMSRNARAGLRRRAIGYVFQDFNLLAGLTAAENVALPLELDGVGQDGPRGRAAGSGGARLDRPRVSVPRRAVWRRASTSGDRPRGGWGSGGSCLPTSRRARWTR
jgi:putative ABC transport system ATP-binding protein